MTLGEAWKLAQAGAAIRREAWAPDRPAVRMTAKDGGDPLGVGRSAGLAHAHLSGEDLDATDWVLQQDA